MSVKRKMRRRLSSPIRSRTTDGREVILAPIVGRGGKIHRFVVVPRLDRDTYLRVD
jgi:hypothetical protein